MTIRQNIAVAKDARARLQAHCMAAKIEESRSHLLVIFPPGYGLSGVRVSMANGIAWACDQALQRMEATWKGHEL